MTLLILSSYDESKMSRKSTTLVLLVFLFAFSISRAEAAKRLLPRVAQTANTAANNTATKTTNLSKGISTNVKFRADRKAVVIEFASLKSATDVSYMFTYDTNGITQGAAGQVSTDQDTTDPRELIFGSCSTNNVCRYDTNITNARLVITSTLLNGTKVIKPYLLKV